MTKAKKSFSGNQTKLAGRICSRTLFLILTVMSFVGLADQKASAWQVEDRKQVNRAETPNKLFRLDAGQRSGLKGQVKVILDPNTGFTTIIGNREDIAVVREMIDFVDSQMAKLSQRINERIRLNFQQAKVVVAILDRAKDLPDSGLAGLSIEPLNFPETILLSGPPASVQRAKLLIRQIDQHPRFPKINQQDD